MEPLRDLDLTTLSLVLHKIRPQLAAAALCYLFEKKIRDLDRNLGDSCEGAIKLAQVLNGLEGKKRITNQFIRDLKKLNNIRNKFLPYNETHGEYQLQNFLKAIQLIDDKLSNSYLCGKF